MLERFIDGLDRQQPDWWIVFANQAEMIDYTRECSDGHSGTVHAKNKVRHDVAVRLLTAIRGALLANIVTANVEVAS